MRKLGVLFCCLALVAWAGPSLAKVSGPCSDCHTMHNSQDGAQVVDSGAAAGFGALTKGDCVGCHSGTNTGTGTRDGNIPYINSTGAPTYGDDGTAGNTLAGGNFYYVTQNDTYGHNVEGIVAQEASPMNAPPGFDGSIAAADATTVGAGAADWNANQLTCGGTYGCHGSHAADTTSWGAVSGGHHTGAAGAITAPGTTAAGGYRFLVGIAGYEDSDHEYQPTASAHNQYKGVATPNTRDNSTISYLCAECHGDFHGTAANIGTASPWLRHPTDLDLGDATGTEYASYNGDGTSYSVSAPVASTNVGSVLSTVTTSSAAGTAIVTCISCHRAHATPFADILRWDYSALQAGDGVAGQQTAGCFVCHTTKDDD